MAAHIETGTMVPPRYRSQTLDHLGLVGGMYEELGIGETIDRNFSLSAGNTKINNLRLKNHRNSIDFEPLNRSIIFAICGKSIT